MGQLTPTAIDRFWVEVNLTLAVLPKPWRIIENVRDLDPELAHELTEGELFLLRERSLERLRVGWEQWLSLYRRAIALVEAEPGVRSGDT